MPPTFYNLLSLFWRVDGVLGLRIDGVCLELGASVIDLLANSKIRFDSVKRMTQIQKTSLGKMDKAHPPSVSRRRKRPDATGCSYQGMPPPARHRRTHHAVGLPSGSGLRAADS